MNGIPIRPFICRVAAERCLASTRTFRAEAPGISATSVESEWSSSLRGEEALLHCSSELTLIPASGEEFN